MVVTNIVIALVSLILGAVICFLGFRYHSKGILKKAEEDAELIKKNKIIEAKEKFIALKLEHENQVRQAEQKLHQQEKSQILNYCQEKPRLVKLEQVLKQIYM